MLIALITLYLLGAYTAVRLSQTISGVFWLADIVIALIWPAIVVYGVVQGLYLRIRGVLTRR